MRNRKNPAIDQAIAEKAAREHAERQQKEAEEKRRSYQLLRIDYSLQLLDLGLDEQVELEYSPSGIRPFLRIVLLPDDQIPKQREQLLKLKQDILAMSGENTAPSAGFVGVDGAPLDSVQAPE